MKKTGWLLRTFRNRGIKFLKFSWNTYLQPIADYCSQVWFPTSVAEMDLLEGTQRSWTRQCPAISNLHPWDRRRIMGIPSLQRRQERFRIITIWKSLEGIIPTQGGIKGEMREYKGRMCIIPPIKSRGRVRKLKEGIMGVRGSLLWNSLPASIRNYGGPGTSIDGFKRILGRYLEEVPDKPRDLSGGWMPNPIAPSGLHSNSLVDWRPFLQRNNPYYNWAGEGKQGKQDSRIQAEDQIS